eukprot:scaffold30186_cov70-Phaeocystis_antarctica.AAC.1
MCPARALIGAWLWTRSRAWLATSEVQGDGLWRYQHVPGEFVAVPPCSTTLRLSGAGRHHCIC